MAHFFFCYFIEITFFFGLGSDKGICNTLNLNNCLCEGIKTESIRIRKYRLNVCYNYSKKEKVTKHDFQFHTANNSPNSEFLWANIKHVKI